MPPRLPLPPVQGVYPGQGVLCYQGVIGPEADAALAHPCCARTSQQLTETLPHG